MLSPAAHFCFSPVLIRTIGCLVVLFVAADVQAAEDQSAAAVYSVVPSVKLADRASRDQDDMCVWVHSEQPDQSVIITADKEAGLILVYDLQGHTLQKVEIPQPGNIDLRNNVTLGDRTLTVVVCNQRAAGKKLRVFELDSAQRQLRSIDNGRIATRSNYGGCLYHSHQTGRLYFISTTKKKGVDQYELSADDQGLVAGRLVRRWQIGKAEGAVACDADGVVYVAEEEHGIWKVGAEPHDSTPGELIAAVANSDLEGDLEGIALAHGDTPHRYLVVSDQGRHRFVVLDRADYHRIVGEFAVAGAESTDGIEIVCQPLGARFPGGVFCCHTDLPGRPTLLSAWQEIVDGLELAQ